ncbi:MAG: sulfatase [Gemmatimonadota bacterium]
MTQNTEGAETSAGRSEWRRYFVFLAVGGIAWTVVATVLVPNSIRSAYQGESWQFLNAIITGHATLSVDDYLEAWWRLAAGLTLAIAALALATAWLLRHRGIASRTAAALGRHVPDLSASDVLVLAGLIGVVGGLSEAMRAVVWYRVLRLSAGEVISGEILWMAPLAATAVLILVALVLLGAAAWPGARWLRGVAPLLFVGLCVFSLGRSTGWGIHPVALAVLATGVGAFAVGVIGRNLGRVRPWTRRALAACVLGLALWAAALTPMRRGMDEWDTRDLPPAAVGAPNVILIVWDTVRALSLSLYGYERHTTPFLERFAERGVVFERATAPAPWTLPSHASMFTGKYHHEHSARHDAPLDGTHLTLAEALRERGYETAGFVANEFYVGPGFGLNRGFDTYEYWRRPSVGGVASTWWVSGFVAAKVRRRFGRAEAPRIPAEDVDRSFLAWLDRRDEERPFFAFLNIFDAHDPYVPPASFGFAFSEPGRTDHWDPNPAHAYSPSELQEMRNAYDSCIYYLDQQLQLLVDELERRGTLDNTLIILTSDHGETLGEQAPNLVGHWTNIYYDVLHVPLLFVYPQVVPDSVEVATPVSLVDLPATVLDLVTDGAPNPFPGHSLARQWDSSVDSTGGAPVSPLLAESHPSDWHERFPNWPISRGPLRSLVQGGQHYIIDSEGNESLFDIREDVWERRDLADTRSGSAVLLDLRRTVDSLMVGAPGGGSINP